MRKYLLSVLGALLVFTAAGTTTGRAEGQNETRTQAQAPSSSQPVCGKRTAIVQRLKDRFSERPVSVGLASNGVVIEIFSANSGSFTILVTRPEGVSCLVASGEGWQELPTRKADLKI